MLVVKWGGAEVFREDQSRGDNNSLFLSRWMDAMDGLIGDVTRKDGRWKEGRMKDGGWTDVIEYLQIASGRRPPNHHLTST